MLNKIFPDSIITIAFIIWSFPLTYFRSRFRKMVYKTDSWWINIKPVFLKEFKVLLGFNNQKDVLDLRFIRFYRFYLIVYFFMLSFVLFK